MANVGVYSNILGVLVSAVLRPSAADPDQGNRVHQPQTGAHCFHASCIVSILCLLSSSQ